MDYQEHDRAVMDRALRRAFRCESGLTEADDRLQQLLDRLRETSREQGRERRVARG